MARCRTSGAIGGFFPDELGLEPGMTAESYAKNHHGRHAESGHHRPRFRDPENDDADEGETDTQESPQEGQETPQDGQNEEGEDSDTGRERYGP